MKYIVGIDEVGRGALAGPVVVVAAAVLTGARMNRETLGELKDSKKLSAKKREAWFAHFKNHPEIAFAIARVYPRQIEKRNISGAANLAASRAYRSLSANRKSQIVRRKLHGDWRSAMCDMPVFLDGGLYLVSHKDQTAHHPNAKTMVKADEKIAAVAIASIIAKVRRDGDMGRLAKKYPEYGFEVHKGYGTKKHYAALEKCGPSAVHRLTFLGKQLIIRK